MAHRLFKGKHDDTGMVIEKKPSLLGDLDLSIKPILMNDIKEGDHIAVNGLRLTVLEVTLLESLDEKEIVFSVTIPKNIVHRTNFQDVQSGSYVTLQKPDLAGIVKGCPDRKCYWTYAKVIEVGKKAFIVAYLEAVKGEEKLMDPINDNSLVALNGEVYRVISANSQDGSFFVKYPALPGRILPAHLQQVGAGVNAHLQQVGAGVKDNRVGTPMNVEINVAQT